MYEVGDVVLSHIPFTDSTDVKVRPAVILFEHRGNIVVAGVTSNEKMDGVPISRAEGLPFDSIIKTNYLFTITAPAIQKRLLKLSNTKRKDLHAALVKHLNSLQH